MPGEKSKRGWRKMAKLRHLLTNEGRATLYGCLALTVVLVVGLVLFGPGEVVTEQERTECIIQNFEAAGSCDLRALEEQARHHEGVMRSVSFFAGITGVLIGYSSYRIMLWRDRREAEARESSIGGESNE